MSRRWTNFIRGPNLNEPLVDDQQPVPDSAEREEDGLRTRKEYEEIINEPSTSKGITRKSKKKTSVKSPALTSPNNLSFPQLQKLSEKNEFKKLKLLLRENNSIDLNQVDEFGWTLLMTAACAGATETVNLLLEAGADWELKNRKGLTAQALAEKKNFKEISSILSDFKYSIPQPTESKRRTAKVAGNLDTGSSGYCESCQIEYTCSVTHRKSIAHLISISSNTPTKTHYVIPESNKGFQILLKTGWDRERGLGPEGEGQKFPVKTILKRDRVGLGSEDTKKQARVTHFGPGDLAAVERQVKPEERLERKRTVEKKAEAKRKCRDRRKEIHFRRDLESL